MAGTKVSRNFHIYEFVPPEIYNRYGLRSRWFIRPGVIRLAQFYRDYFSLPVTINNWYWGGHFEERGYRTPSTRVGAKYSQHKLGAAFDCNVGDLPADEVREEIFARAGAFMKMGLTTVEHGDYAPTWVHSDIRSTGMDKLLVVKPIGVQRWEVRFEVQGSQLRRMDG